MLWTDESKSPTIRQQAKSVCSMERDIKMSITCQKLNTGGTFMVWDVISASGTGDLVTIDGIISEYTELTKFCHKLNILSLCNI